MTDIKLEELPKSKEFMEHARTADILSKKTGLEHGFTFCKPNDKIVVDKICSGTECTARFSPEICGKEASSFHTHPNKKPINSTVGSGDIYEASRKSNVSQKPNIHCAKSTTDDLILCQKIIPPTNRDNMMKIWALSDVRYEIEYNEDIDDKSFFAVEKTLSDMMNKINRPKHILFGGNVGEIHQVTIKGQSLFPRQKQKE